MFVAETNENISMEKKTFVLNIIWVVFLFGKFILDVSKSEYYHIMLSYSSIFFFRILIYVCFIWELQYGRNLTK